LGSPRRGKAWHLRQRRWRRLLLGAAARPHRWHQQHHRQRRRRWPSARHDPAFGQRLRDERVRCVEEGRL